MAFIGIDLGTTTCEAAVFRGGKTQMLRDEAGNEIVKSVVGLHHKTKELVFGDLAASQLALHPELSITEIKRKMGTDEITRLGDKDYRPEEISGLLLRKIKDYAGAHLGEEVTRAVITVPANFNDRQRSATKIAGEYAGLIVERIINEPTAAALAFGIESTDEGILMVYDLGGGTFDVTILEYAGGVLDVKASAGDNHLGGQDFDRQLAELIVNRFKSEEGVDLSEDSQALARVVESAAEAKKELSFSTATSVNLPFIASRDGKPLSLEVEITRSEFEDLITPHLERTEKAMDKALREAGIQISDVDIVLLVGGSTRIPAVKELVEKKTGKAPRSDVDPDRAVAIGAAIQASIIDGDSDTIIMDICPLSLGTSVVTTINGQYVNGVYSEVLPANTPQLKACSETYNTVADDQEVVMVDIYQKDSLSDSIWCRDHTLLHSKEVEGLTPMPAGKEAVKLTYTYNLNGILDVEVTVVSTGTSERFSVETDLKGQVDTANIDDLWEKSEKGARVRATIHTAEKKIKELGGHQALEDSVAKLKTAVVEGNDAAIDRLDEQITDIVFDLE